MEHHLSLHTRFSTILYMLLPSMGANKVLGEVHGEKHNHGRGKWSIHCHWTAWIKPIRDCLSRHRRQHIFMEDTLSFERLVTWYKALRDCLSRHRRQHINYHGS